MPYVSANTGIFAAREVARGTKPAFAASGFGAARRIGVTDRRVEFPDPKQEWKKYWSHNGTRYMHRQVAQRTDFGPSPFPLVLLDAFPIFLATGREYTNGTYNAGASTTLNGAVAAGATTVTVTSSAGMNIGDVVEIGNAEASPSGKTYVTECWEITGIAGNVLTIGTGSYGLTYAHATGATVRVVEAPYTHNFETPTGVYKPTASIQALMNDEDDVSPRFLRTFLGGQMNSWELSAEDPSGDGGDLRLNSQVAALDIADDDFASDGLPVANTDFRRPTFADVDPYYYYHTAGLVTAFGRTMGTIESFRMAHDDKPVVKRYFGSSSGQNPSAMLTHRPEYDFTMTFVPDDYAEADNSVWYLLKGRTKGDIKIPFVRDLGVGGVTGWADSDDAVQIWLKDCAIASAPKSFGDDGDEISVPCQISPTSWVIQVKDSTPMYSAL